MVTVLGGSLPSTVAIQPLKLGRFEVTFAEWDLCVAEGGCSHIPDDEGWGRGDIPVGNISWDHITTQFIPWLNRRTQQVYRLPTGAEWEYAARADSTTRYYWGEDPSGKHANGNQQYGSDWPRDGYPYEAAPVGSYLPNAFGLHDMVGNVSEWVADCGDKSSTQFSDESGYPTGSCKSRVDRGGSWSSYECCIGYASNHDYIWPNLSKSSDLQRGFRLAQDI